MKSRQPFSMAIPQFLTPYIERFLSEIRPQIPGAEEHHWLWASSSGGGLCGQAIFKIVTDRTTAAFGHPVNPHLFRSIAATTIAVSTPGQVRLSRDLLGHARLDTTERYYNLAGSIQAGQDYANALETVRKTVAPKAGARQRSRPQ